VTVGDGVFESIKTVSGKPFALTPHLERLAMSAALMKLKLPPIEEVRTAIANVCALAEVQNAPVGRMRVTCTSGVGALGSDRSDDWTLIVAWSPAPAWPETARLEIVSVPRNERSPLAGAKTTSYADNVLAIVEAKAAGADEALLLNLAGFVCEGASSNVFIVKDQRVSTPSLQSGCLAGVTRSIVLKQNPDIVERQISVDELLEADEVFITSSTRDLQPVARVGVAQYSAPGDFTKKAMAIFSDRAKEHFDE
jgi:branched-chain amino acid aminotransferase